MLVSLARPVTSTSTRPWGPAGTEPHGGWATYGGDAQEMLVLPFVSVHAPRVIVSPRVLIVTSLPRTSLTDCGVPSTTTVPCTAAVTVPFTPGRTDRRMAVQAELASVSLMIPATEETAASTATLTLVRPVTPRQY